MGLTQLLSKHTGASLLIATAGVCIAVRRCVDQGSGNLFVIFPAVAPIVDSTLVAQGRQAESL